MRCHNEAYKVKKLYGIKSIAKGRRKRHAGDCGRARCGLCHGYKFPKREKTRTEIMANNLETI